MLNRDEMNPAGADQDAQGNDFFAAAIEENTKRASNFYNSSVNFLKSFSQQASEQLRRIQQKGLINDVLRLI